MKGIFRHPSGQCNLFRIHDSFREAALKKDGGKFARRCSMIDFEKCRAVLIQAIEDDRVAHGGKTNQNLRPAGRYAMDPVFILKCLIAQRMLGLADDAFHQAMLSNNLLQHFLDLNDPQEVPSPKTIWKYKNIFARTGVMEKIFQDHVQSIQESVDKVGDDAVIVDSSFVEAPKQRNTREENDLIKQGKGDTLWNDNPHKKCHKDIDASWTKKRDETHYGYKGHFTVCADTKMILDVFSTTAKVHDAKVVDQYLHFGREGGRLFYADAGYAGKNISEKLEQAGLIPMICEKGYKGKPLTEEQKQSNKELSKVRSRIEHVFGFIEKSLGGSIVRSVGMVRAKFNIALTALVYNMCRLEQLLRHSALPGAKPLGVS